MNYRITKYNPENRDEQGRFLVNDWTSYGDIVIPYDFQSYSEYIKVEKKYLNYLSTILENNNIQKLKVRDLELKDYEGIGSRLADCNLSLLEKTKKNVSYSRQNVIEIAQLTLREIIWCRLEYKSIYVHFGYDFYMYVGGIVIDENLISKAKSEDLYIEIMNSPYAT